MKTYLPEQAGAWFSRKSQSQLMGEAFETLVSPCFILEK